MKQNSFSEHNFNEVNLTKLKSMLKKKIKMVSCVLFRDRFFLNSFKISCRGIISLYFVNKYSTIFKQYPAFQKLC